MKNMIKTGKKYFIFEYNFPQLIHNILSFASFLSFFVALIIIILYYLSCKLQTRSPSAIHTPIKIIFHKIIFVKRTKSHREFNLAKRLEIAWNNSCFNFHWYQQCFLICVSKKIIFFFGKYFFLQILIGL